LSPNTPAINTTACRIKRVRYSHLRVRCEMCGRFAPRAWEISRTAIDVDLDGPVFLLVTVGVHHCRHCGRHFRAQPPFLRKGAIYTERVRQKATLSVYEDGMAVRRVTGRLARDFWVSPSEAMVRRWCHEYAESLEFSGDYQRWVIEEFSGVLCVDEVYQDELALLVAVDPAVPNGDRLVGYQLVHGEVDRKKVEGFLGRLRRAGIEPDQVVTDGSPLYSKTLKEIWPAAAHQLCLFHESRLVTGEIYKAVAALRKKGVPEPPPVRPKRTLKGLPGKNPSPEKVAFYQQAIAQVFSLREQGVSIQEIRRQTGHSRNTIKKWLSGGAPRIITETQLPAGITPEEILEERSPDEQGAGTTSEIPEPPSPPSPWSDWEQVRKVRKLLWECRYVMLRRPDHLGEEQREDLRFLMESPVGEQVGLVREFLESWYALFHDEQRNRRSPQEAKDRYERLRRDERYRTLKPLARLQARLTEEHFEKVSSFLRSPQWEATNNGAERGARAFRHLQAPHYNFRKSSSIDDAIKARAWLCRQQNTMAQSPPPGRCARGRRTRRTMGMMAAA
jgi:lambda repressor-like predicted transcriptional regulator